MAVEGLEEQGISSQKRQGTKVTLCELGMDEVSS
jgi:hypothetical protein